MAVNDNTIYMKQNDRKPNLVATLMNEDNDPYNLSGATVKFHMTDSTGSIGTKINADASIVSEVLGQVQYVWASGDLDTIGTYYGEFEVTFSTGVKMTFPVKEDIIIIVRANII